MFLKVSGGESYDDDRWIETSAIIEMKYDSGLHAYQVTLAGMENSVTITDNEPARKLEEILGIGQHGVHPYTPPQNHS